MELNYRRLLWYGGQCILRVPCTNSNQWHKPQHSPPAVQGNIPAHTRPERAMNMIFIYTWRHSFIPYFVQEHTRRRPRSATCINWLQSPTSWPLSSRAITTGQCFCILSKKLLQNAWGVWKLVLMFAILLQWSAAKLVQPDLANTECLIFISRTCNTHKTMNK